MIGVYVIADADGRVYYVGKSKQIEKRAKKHLYEMSREENDWRKNKMYWLLGRMYYTQPMDLGLYVIRECKEEELKVLEEKMIRVLKPVLNSQIPVGGEKFIDDIECVTDAVVYADWNGLKNFNGLKRLW